MMKKKSIVWQNGMCVVRPAQQKQSWKIQKHAFPDFNQNVFVAIDVVHARHRKTISEQIQFGREKNKINHSNTAQWHSGGSNDDIDNDDD